MLTREYLELGAELAHLVQRLAACDAFVFDAWALVWAVSRFPGIALRDRMFSHAKHVLESTSPAFVSGATLDRLHDELEPPLYCRSFARVYVLGVWVPPGTDEHEVRGGVRVALPRIEALTLALPPPPGHGSFPQATSRRP